MRFIKLATAMAAAVMALALSACGSSAPAPQEQSSAASEPVAATSADAQPETSAATSAPVESGQNPVMNFVGPYAADRASMMIEADGANGAIITIDWASSATENTEWVMTGTFDEAALAINYTGCTKTETVYKDDGSIETETDVYSDGTGSIVFSADGSPKATWQDDKEDAGAGLVFTFNA